MCMLRNYGRFIAILAPLLSAVFSIAVRADPPASIAGLFEPPERYRNDFGKYRSPLMFDDGSMAQTPEQWELRKREIVEGWFRILGPWPDLINQPRAVTVRSSKREHGIEQRQLQLGIGIGGEMVDTFLLIPPGTGPFPAVVVPYYDAQTGAGLGVPLRDFGWELAKRGFMTLSIGKPNSGVNLKDVREAGHRGQYFGPRGQPIQTQPLSALAYTAACAHQYLANRSDVDGDRIGIVGHSFGGKWSLFASCLYDRFACAAWSDPGIVFDERDRRKENPGGSVNYWDPWYLGFELGRTNDGTLTQRFRKLPSEGEPRTGAYRVLIQQKRDLVELHALMAPRPVLVSGGTADLPERWTALNHLIQVNKLLGFRHRVAMSNRQTHAPTSDSNEQIYAFFEWWLKKRDEDN